MKLLYDFKASPKPVAAARTHVRAFCEATGVSEERTTEILLAIGEALSNAVEHAYERDPGPIDLHLIHQGDEIAAEVVDKGAWRARPRLTNRGFGEEIMRKLADRFEREHAAGTRVRLAFRLSPAQRSTKSG